MAPAFARKATSASGPQFRRQEGCIRERAQGLDLQSNRPLLQGTNPSTRNSTLGQIQPPEPQIPSFSRRRRRASHIGASGPDAEPSNFHHPKLGQASHQWSYNTMDGGLIGYVTRFETQAGKAILPLAFSKARDGRCPWHWKLFEKPRPSLICISSLIEAWNPCCLSRARKQPAQHK
jgi:hypothetical protein